MVAHGSYAVKLTMETDCRRYRVEAALAVVVVVRGAEWDVSRRSGQQTRITGFSVLVCLLHQ